MTTKQDLLAQMVSLLETELMTAATASDQARDGATHGESKAENKYDTRGLEAAYLAHGLSVRVEALRRDLSALRSWKPRDFVTTDAIGVGAWVRLCDEQDALRQIFIAQLGGGLKLTSDDGPVLVVTPSAPMARQLLGRERGDEITLMINQQTHTYWVYAVR